MTFDTDEPCLGTVRYGLACGALTGTTTGAGYHTSHGVHLTSLEKSSTYYFVVDAEDEAGNVSTDDNGGLCYTFDTPDAPDFYTEQFESGFDLDGYKITFTPDGSNDFYHACVEEIDSLPTDPSGSTELVLSDDDYETISLTGPPRVWLYGQPYAEFHVGGNGYITFASGDSDYTETLAEHFNQPRISMLFDDLSPQNGTVSWKQVLDRAVVTFEDVPEYTSTGSNTFQVEMYFAGKIVLAYLGVTANDGIVGLSEGEGLSPDYLPTDLSELGCYAVGDMNCSGVVDFFDIDGFILAITDPAGYEAAYPDCDIMLADCNGDGIVNFFDIDVFVALITG